MNDHDGRGPRQPACQEVRAWLSTAEERTAVEQARLQAHLVTCEECRAVASWIDDVDQLARGVPAPPGPDPAYFASLRAGVMREITARTPRPSPARRGWRSLLRLPVLAPAVLVVVLASVFTFQQWRHGPVQVAPTTPGDQRALPEPSPFDKGATRRVGSVGSSATQESRQVDGKDEEAKKLEAGRDTPPAAEKAQLAREEAAAPVEAPVPTKAGSTLPEPAAVSQRATPSTNAAVPDAAQILRREPGPADVISAGSLDESLVRRSLETARKQAGRPDETMALARLLDAMEGRADATSEAEESLNLTVPSLRPKEDERIVSRASAESAQPTLEGTRAQPHAPPSSDADVSGRMGPPGPDRPEAGSTGPAESLASRPANALVLDLTDSRALDLADSVAAYFRVRLGAVADAALRQRIESWLQEYAKTETSRE